MFKTWVNAVGVKAPFFGSCENEDSENDDIRPPPTKTKTNYENEDPPYENEDPSRKRRHISNKFKRGWYYLCGQRLCS